MRPIFLTAAIAVALAASPALADKGHKQNKHASPAQMGCPPGLAKKGNGCLPPGQAKKLRHHYDIGDRLPRGEYRLIERPWRYGLPRGGDYAVVDGYAYRIDRGTARIIAAYGLLKALTD